MTGRKHGGQAAQAAVPKPSEFESAARHASLAMQRGKNAVKSEYRSGIEAGESHTFVASVDIDAHFKVTEPNSFRWDYGVGLRSDAGHESLWWVEPHPASSSGEVSRMLEKLDWLKGKLGQPRFAGLLALTNKARAQGIAFRWLAITGTVAIRPDTSEARRLALHGLAAPARRVVLPRAGRAR
jgi:hypothetical protein